MFDQITVTGAFKPILMLEGHRNGSKEDCRALVGRGLETETCFGPSQKGTVASVAPHAFGGETLRSSILFERASVAPLDDFAKVFVAFQSSS